VDAVEEAVQITNELEPIIRGWSKLGLGELDARSVRALQNRRSEGATVEQLEAAVAAAATDEWLRRRAKVPFAVVFASVASIERFAHQGRKNTGRDMAARNLVGDLQRRLERSPRTEAREPRFRSDAGGSPLSPNRALLPWIAKVPPRSRASDDLSQRRMEQLERLKIWSRENGIE
jgi:hypothetical protein